MYITKFIKIIISYDHCYKTYDSASPSIYNTSRQKIKLKSIVNSLFTYFQHLFIELYQNDGTRQSEVLQILYVCKLQICMHSKSY